MPRQYNRSVHLKHRYGITEEEYQAMMTRQGWGCALCGRKESRGKSEHFYVDHCHETNRVRGGLCAVCNAGLGRLGDTPAAIRRVLDYVEGNLEPGWLL